MNTVEEILKTKGDHVWSITSDSLADRGLEIMADKDIGALMVIDGGELKGIFSERDYVRRVALKGEKIQTTTVGEIMSTDAICVGRDATVEECMKLMTEKHIRHLPVEQNGRLVGVVTIGDIVKQVISAQRETIGQLENYITGGFGK